MLTSSAPHTVCHTGVVPGTGQCGSIECRTSITWGLLDLVDRISHLTCPTIAMHIGVFMHETWQSPLVKAQTRAHELLGTTIVGVNEAVRQNFPAHVRDDVVIIPNGSVPGRVYPVVVRDELTTSLSLAPMHNLVV